MKEFITNCAYCGLEFTGKNRKATYCSNSCRVMASRKRQNEENEEYQKHKTKLDWEYIKLNKTKQQLIAERREFQAQKVQQDNKQNEFSELFDKYWPQILIIHDLSRENERLKAESLLYRKRYYKALGIDIDNE